MTIQELAKLQTFDGDEPYGQAEQAAIAELERHSIPTGYIRRGASAAMMRVMQDLAADPEACLLFSQRSREFVNAYGDFDEEERNALESHTIAAMRKVTNDRLDDEPDRPLETVRKVVRQHIKFAIQWGPMLQMTSTHGRIFVHEGSTRTHLSHDLAHLLIAVSRQLPWMPEGDDRDAVKIAEYTAVFLEHLLNNTYNNVMVGKDPEIFVRTLAHARWFVQEHFPPFPMSPGEAFGQFCCHLDTESIVDLCLFRAQAKRTI